MIETKVMKVHPSNTESTINTFASFGWTLASCKPIFSGELSQHTGDELVFSRDTKMLHYNELNYLYQEYTLIDMKRNELYKSGQDKGWEEASRIKKRTCLLVGIIVLVLVGLIHYAIHPPYEANPEYFILKARTFSQALFGSIFVGLICDVLIIPVLFIILDLVLTDRYRTKYHKKNEIEMNSILQKMRSIEIEARKLL